MVLNNSTNSCPTNNSGSSNGNKKNNATKKNNAWELQHAAKSSASLPISMSSVPRYGSQTSTLQNLNNTWGLYRG